MGLFNFFGQTNSQNKPKQEQSKEDMKKRLMEKLTVSLSDHNFTKMEIMQVYDIIELAEADIQNLRDTLNQIKKTSSDPTAALGKIKKEIEQIQQQMAIDIKEKVKEIKRRKMMMKRNV